MQDIDGQCKQRDRNPKKEPKRNVRHEENTVTVMKNAFDRLISSLNKDEKRISARGCINRILEK